MFLCCKCKGNGWRIGHKNLEVVLEKRHHRIVYVNEMQFGFMSEREIVDVEFIL